MVNEIKSKLIELILNKDYSNFKSLSEMFNISFFNIKLDELNDELKNKFSEKEINIFILSCKESTIDIVKYIYEKMEDINVKNNLGNNALVVSILNKNKDREEIINFLFKNKISISDKNNEGDNALMIALKNKEIDIFYHKDIIEIIDREQPTAGIEFINQTDNENNTLLMLSCTKEYYNYDVITLLFKVKNLDVNILNDKKENPFIYAFKNNNFDLFYILFQAYPNNNFNIDIYKDYDITFNMFNLKKYNLDLENKMNEYENTSLIFNLENTMQALEDFNFDKIKIVLEFFALAEKNIEDLKNKLIKELDRKITFRTDNIKKAKFNKIKALLQDRDLKEHTTIRIENKEDDNLEKNDIEKINVFTNTEENEGNLLKDDENIKHGDFEKEKLENKDDNIKKINIIKEEQKYIEIDDIKKNSIDKIEDEIKIFQQKQKEKFLKEDYKAIKNIEDLLNIENKGKYFLDNNLDLKEINFNPIGLKYLNKNQWIDEEDNEEYYISIDFDGNFYTIRNLNILKDDDNDNAYCGLFAYLNNSNIKNLNIVDAKIKANGDCVGILAGVATECHIENCFINGEIIANSNRVGGIIGFCTEEVNIIYCGAAVKIQAKEIIGGLVGHNRDSFIINSYTKATLLGTNIIGGLVGNNRTSKIKNCLSKSILKSQELINGNIYEIVGSNSDGEIVNCYSSEDIKDNIIDNFDKDIWDINKDSFILKNLSLSLQKKYVIY